MGILFSNQIKVQLTKELLESKESVQIISAYCKESALEFFEHNLSDSLTEKKLMVRFSLGDILSKATDFTLYEYCKNNNWDLYIKPNIHAKTYVFDHAKSIVGSSNLTQRGMVMGENGNYEIAALVNMEINDKKKVDELFKSAFLMNDDLYSKMKEDLLKVDTTCESFPKNWNIEIRRLIADHVVVLFTYEFPSTESPYKLVEGSLEFLELPEGSGIEVIRESFENCTAYLWLIDVLHKNDGVLYFGSISEKMHNALINDPEPYRKEVKELLNNLLNWISDLQISEIIIDQPNYSKRVSLRSRHIDNVI